VEIRAPEAFRYDPMGNGNKTAWRKVKNPAYQLSADIDSGRTGDKNPALDPSLAPLGTDDEAAGTPPTPFRVMLARRLENLNRWVRSSSRAAGPKPDSDLILFLSVIGAISLVLLAGVVFASRA
jgi:hypothetical protein